MTPKLPTSIQYQPRKLLCINTGNFLTWVSPNLLTMKTIKNVENRLKVGQRSTNQNSVLLVKNTNRGLEAWEGEAWKLWLGNRSLGYVFLIMKVWSGELKVGKSRNHSFYFPIKLAFLFSRKAATPSL